ncbi:cytochrome c [uncultured Kiloniella sp.]|uniref:c-type cytochrome n=1 Tax=uncultured Kiloniella sp. TaxID=1133091 RepID=UPI00261138E1|nr:cytochrome c [uncultured Kiloniella sp.]
MAFRFWGHFQRQFLTCHKIILSVAIGIIVGSYFIFYSPDLFQKSETDNKVLASDFINTLNIDEGNIVEGGKLYQQNCASCHGIQLEGETNWRSPKEDGSLRAPPHNKDGHTWHHPDRILFHITKFGGAAIAPEGFNSNMPAFNKTLSDTEINKVLAFIKSKWPKEIRQRQKNISDKDKASLSQ